jgi:hypothetical protein
MLKEKFKASAKHFSLSKVQTSFMIKIFTISSLIYLMPFLVNAQFQTGQKVVAANIDVNFYNDKNTSTSTSENKGWNVNFHPSIGKFYKPNLLRGIGLSYGYSYSKTKSSISTDIEKTNNNLIGIDLFAERFFSLSENLFFTFQTVARVNYRFGKNTTTSPVSEIISESKGYGLGVGLTPGFSYRLSRRFLFDAHLSDILSAGYNYSEMKVSAPSAGLPKSTNSNFNLSSSLSNTNLGNVGLGFRWLLAKK